MVEDDLVRLCDVCETSRGAGDGSHLHQRPGGDDLARGDADPRLERVALRQFLAKIDRGPNGTKGVVFVQRGKAECRANCVRESPGQLALVAVDHDEHVLQRSFQPRRERLGIRHLGAGRAEVHVHDRDRLAHRGLGCDAFRYERGKAERRVLAQDRALQRAQLRARLEPEFLDEQAPSFAVSVERVRLPPGAVQRQHQLGAKTLLQRVFGDESLELADKLGVATKSEIGLDPRLDGNDPQVLETRNLGLSERLEREVGECRSAPEVEAVVEESGCRGGVTDRDRPSALVEQPLEAVRVELVGPKLQHIPRGECAEEVGSEDLADLRDVDTHRLKSGRRRSLAPQLID
jgi:hypothetical protein